MGTISFPLKTAQTHLLANKHWELLDNDDLQNNKANLALYSYDRILQINRNSAVFQRRKSFILRVWS